MNLESLIACFIDSLPFLISWVSFLIGAVGLWFSYKSYKNTQDIVEAINTEKLKEKYRIKHPKFVEKIKSILTELRNKNRSYQIVIDLYEICLNIQVLNDGWQPDDQKRMRSFFQYLDTIPNNTEIDVETWCRLQKETLLILAILERVGGLEKIE